MLKELNKEIKEIIEEVMDCRECYDTMQECYNATTNELKTINSYFKVKQYKNEYMNQPELLIYINDILVGEIEYNIDPNWSDECEEEANIEDAYYYFDYTIKWCDCDENEQNSIEGYVILEKLIA